MILSPVCLFVHCSSLSEIALRHLTGSIYSLDAIERIGLQLEPGALNPPLGSYCSRRIEIVGLDETRLTERGAVDPD